MKKRFLIRFFQIVIALVALIAAFAVTPLVIAVLNSNIWQGFVLYFGAYMLLNGLLLSIILPGEGKDFAIPWLKRWFTVKEGRFDKGLWPCFQRKGPFVLSLVAGIAFGPFFGTVVLRYLGIEGQQAWVYSFLITVISGVVSVAIYSGAIDIIKAIFA